MATTKRAPKSSGRLKNYTSEASEASIFEAIRQSLSTHKARRIVFDYDNLGRAISIEFALEVRSHTLHFRLPARIGSVARLVKQSMLDAGRGISDERLVTQAYRTAWANIRDWVEAQMALVDAEMVRPEEVFLPYLLNESGKTYFEAFDQQLALPVPKPKETAGSAAYTITEV